MPLWRYFILFFFWWRSRQTLPLRLGHRRGVSAVSFPPLCLSRTSGQLRSGSQRDGGCGWSGSTEGRRTGFLSFFTPRRRAVLLGVLLDSLPEPKRGWCRFNLHLFSLVASCKIQTWWSRLPTAGKLLKKRISRFCQVLQFVPARITRRARLFSLRSDRSRSRISVRSRRLLSSSSLWTRVPTRSETRAARVSFRRTSDRELSVSPPGKKEPSQASAASLTLT